MACDIGIPYERQVKALASPLLTELCANEPGKVEGAPNSIWVHVPGFGLAQLSQLQPFGEQSSGENGRQKLNLQCHNYDPFSVI